MPSVLLEPFGKSLITFKNSSSSEYIKQYRRRVGDVKLPLALDADTQARSARRDVHPSEVRHLCIFHHHVRGD